MDLGSIQAGSTQQFFSSNNREETKGTRTQDKQNLSDDQQKEVRELKKRDQEVKTHEAAHMSAGGAYVRGGATYSYQSGPDGNRYAIGGEVSIDASPVSGDPRATIQKMQTVISAALAPADPSGQDRSVASQAGAAEAQARKELSQQETGGSGNNGNETTEADKKNEHVENGKPTSGKSEIAAYHSDGKAHFTQHTQSKISFYA